MGYYKDAESQKTFLSTLECVDYRGRPVDYSKTGRWKATMFLLVAEVLERFAYFGVVANLVTYLTSILHQGTVQSSTNLFNWGGVTWIVPLFGAFLADAYLGRFRTLIIFDIPYLVGMICLTISVALPQLRPPQCPASNMTCTLKASKGELGFFWFSLYLIAIALAGVKPCIIVFAGDQFDEGIPSERQRKQSYFNWFFNCIQLGAFLAQTTLVYIQDNVGWGWGYGIPTAGVFLGFLITLAGTPFYRYQKLPKYSPFTCVLQVFVAALRKRRAIVPADKTKLYEGDDSNLLDVHKRHKLVCYTAGFSFLDKAAVLTLPTPDTLNKESQAGAVDPEKIRSKVNPWQECPVTQVEEVKQLLRLIPIWISNSIFSITFPSLVTTYFTKQGRTMDRHMGPNFQIPPASLQGFITFSLLILIPLYDRFFVPLARRITGNERGISILKRMGTGNFFSILACVTSALVEMKRLKVVREHGLLDNPSEVVPLTIFWLLPQYLMIGLCELFASIAMFEFYYSQVSSRLRTLSSAVSLSSIGVGLFWSTALTQAVVAATARKGRQGWIVNNLNRCRLDKFYWLCAIIMTLNFLFFLVVSRQHDYRADEPVEQCDVEADDHSVKSFEMNSKEELGQT